jgi:hypothetical protein
VFRAAQPSGTAKRSQTTFNEAKTTPAERLQTPGLTTESVDGWCKDTGRSKDERNAMQKYYIKLLLWSLYSWFGAEQAKP